MDYNIYKYRRLERYLNFLQMKGIKIGSLMGQAFEIDYYNHINEPSKDLSRILKYLSLLFFPKSIRPNESRYIITKLIDRYHFNELIDPIIIHFLNQSTIICNNNSFNETLKSKYPISQHSVDIGLTVNNVRADTIKILFIFFKASWMLIKQKNRLGIRKEQILFFLSQLILQLRSISFWDHYFSNSTKPLCVITEFDRNNISSVLVCCARKYKILTITLTHGVICDYGFTPVLADYIFCWGELQKNQLLSQGVPLKKIVITGNPMIKYFENVSNFPFTETKICFAISPEYSNRSMIISFISALKNFNQLKGIIKLHPSLYKHDFNWITDLSSQITILSSDEITNNQLFDDIALLVIHQSGIANEALSFGIPVVIFEPIGKNNFSQLQNQLINVAKCKVATNTEELTQILGEFVSDPCSYKEQNMDSVKTYLRSLYEFVGDESIKSMINGINQLTA